MAASSVTGSAIQQVPEEVGGVSAKWQRIMSVVSGLPLFVATPLAFLLGGAEGAGIVLAVLPVLMSFVVMALAALGLDPKLRSALLAVIGVLSGVTAVGGLVAGLHLFVALCAGGGALFALLGAGVPFIRGDSFS